MMNNVEWDGFPTSKLLLKLIELDIYDAYDLDGDWRLASLKGIN